MYNVEIDFSPVYELITSLYTYLEPSGRQINELGNRWVRNVEKSLEPQFREELKDKKLEVLHRLSLLVWQCPHKKSVDQFIDWLEALAPSEVYSYLLPWVRLIPKDTIEMHNYVIMLLRKWNEQYFRHLDPAILKTLERDASQKKELMNHMPPADLVETCTNGMRIESVSIHKVLLIPQYHQAPFSVTDYYNGLITCLYPVDIEDDHAYLSKKIVRQIRSLGDKKRIQMLKYLFEKSRSFSDIQQFTGLAKSNAHYHLQLLRTAGFIRAHHNSERVESYSLREGMLEQMHEHLSAYIKGE